MLLPLDRDDASAFVSEDGDERFLEALLWHGLRSESDPGHAQPLTQERLVELSGLARNSVKAYASTKLRRVLENGSSLSLNPETGYALGIDLGRTHEARVVLTDLRGHWDEGKTPHQRGDADEEFGSLEPKELWTAVELAWDVMESKGITPAQLVGVGVGIATPSAPDVNAGNAAFGHWQRWASSGNLLRSALNARWEAKGRGENAWSSVKFVDENDTNLSAIADYLWGGGQKCRSSLFVKWNAGVRAALILDGCLFTGSAGYAGELPHVKVKVAEEEDRRLASRILDQECGSATCTVEGKKGCLYGIAPIEKISKIAKTEQVDQIIKRAGDPDSEYDELRIALKAAAEGIGSALAPLAIGINAEEIVIGGALGARAYPLVLESLRQGVESRARVAEFAVTNSTIRNRGTVRGAAALALLKFGPAYLKKAALATPTNGSGRKQGSARPRRQRRSAATVS